MLPMPIGDLEKICDQIADEGRRIQVLWQVPQSLAFVARGREYRSEFHIDPADELMYMIKGEMNLHYRDENGNEDISVL
ncbi:MAG: 3-hydroxybutyryl-CoA dehydratase, partial [Pseudomonadota bacterium]|nr:3-hydroxybutyryl-CoA dehydratase [Pseudomonadota bacterium]